MKQYDYAKQALQLIDLTSLNDSDTEQNIIELCHQAHTNGLHVAALCVYPQFISLAKTTLAQLALSQVLIATVVNFPSGNDPLDMVIAQTKQALDNGADEIDCVMPYQALMNGDEEKVLTLIQAVKNECGQRTLKVIIESGLLADETLIKRASELAIEAGADFIKTSTGKVPVNATLLAASVMLNVIKQSNQSVGFKAAGGVKTLEQACEYLNLATEIMGPQWINPEHFRFGASGLLHNLQLVLTERAPEITQTPAADY
ncbi:deoxyribose-phosphate aldolase [Pseudoalteromonas ulvae]|uniref:Deoxyribose-phosphate aldolase n=1 Tax=Pseudoalteromonas ulvae TaxID=107327 RepID=A0A244CR70_PSEDV|nr:deoxyribose-phosphate aldolase [Pseudoalteromonas ulvae]OUL58102.1 deoxyribose-phosphate aldolase [Pseudoalteromonas ulvae]